MLNYIYTLDYSDAFSLDGPILCNVKVLECAYSYDIASLRNLAFSKLALAAETQWSTAYFLDAISHIYTLAPSSLHLLRPIIVTIAIKNQDILNAVPSFVRMLKAIPEFGVDLLNSRGNLILKGLGVKKSIAMRKVVCGQCQFVMVCEKREVVVQCPSCECGGPGLFEEVKW